MASSKPSNCDDVRSLPAVNGSTPVPLGQDRDGRAIWDWEPRPTHGEFPWFYQRRDESNEDYCRRTGRDESPMQRLALEAAEEAEADGDAGEAVPFALPQPEYFKLADERDEADYLLHGLLVRGESSLLVGGPKVGKSTFGRNLAAAVCNGSEWMTRPTRKAPCLLLALQESPGLIRSEFQKMGVGTDRELPDLHIVHPKARFSFEAVEGYVREQGIGFLIVDMLGRVAGYEDSNDYDDAMPKTLRFTEIARDTGAHVMLVHHGAKRGGNTPSERTLGSQAIAGEVDVVCSIHWQGSKRRFEAEGRGIKPMEWDPVISAILERAGAPCPPFRGATGVDGFALRLSTRPISTPTDGGKGE